jgi:hypothetical protein
MQNTRAGTRELVSVRLSRLVKQTVTKYAYQISNRRFWIKKSKKASVRVFSFSPLGDCS